MTTNTQTIIINTIKEAFAPYTAVATEVINERLVVTAEGIATPLVTVKNFAFLSAFNPTSMSKAVDMTINSAIAFHFNNTAFSFSPKTTTSDMYNAYMLATEVQRATGVEVKATFSGNTLTLIDKSTTYHLDADGEPYGVVSNVVLFTVDNYFTRAVDEYDAIVNEAIVAVAFIVDNPFDTCSSLSLEEMMAEEYGDEQQAIYADHVDPFADGVAVDEDNLLF